MVTIEQKKIASQEQNPTLKSNVETSEKDQKIDEVIHESKMDQEILGLDQGVTTEYQTLEEDITDSKKDQEISTIEEDVKTKSKTLEQEVTGKTPIDLANQEIVKVEAIKDNKKLKEMANIRITKCNSLLDGLKGNRKSKRQLKDNIKRAVSDMEKMIEDEHIYETNMNQYKNRLGKIIYDYYTNREPARQIIMMGGRVPTINGTADTKREAKKDKRRAKDNTEYQIDLSEIKKNTALYTLIGVSANEWGDYCDFIGQGGIAIGHPVYIQHTAGFNNIREYNPDIYRAITPEGQITYNTYCQRDPARYEAYCRNNNTVYRQRAFNETAGEGLYRIAESLGANKDNDPRKRQARQQAGSILAIGGAVIMGFKFFKNLFSKKSENENKWRKAAGRGAGLLALLNIRGVENRIENISGWHPAEKSRMLAESFKTYGLPDEIARDMVDRYVGAPVTTMSALHFIPIYELESQHILENNNGEINFIYGNFENYVNKFSWDRSQKEQVLKAGKKLDKDKSIGTGLKAFGITTRDKLRSLFGSDKKKTLADTDEVKNGWGKMVERVQHGVNKDLYNHGLRIKNPDDMDTIMAEYGDGQKSKEEVNKLMLKRMKSDLLELNSDDKPYTIKDMLNNPNINLENMTMKGFTNSGGTEIKFDSYGDLFETVRLTKRIKENFSGRPAKSDNPFHIDELNGRIEFDDTEWYEIWKNETDVVKNRTLKKTSSLLTKNKQFYVDYLNKWRKEDQNRIIDENKIDLSGYPILKNTGINFTDADEAHKSEQLLNKIKYELRNREKRVVGDAFEIKTTSVTNKTNIEFTTRGGQIKKYDITDYPTLIKNEKKLLQYINNPQNRMRGSERP